MFDNIGRLFINTLAVGGAFLLAAWMTEFVLWGSCRYFLHKSPPLKARKVLGWMAGTVAALLIFLMLFGGFSTGGWLGGGRGDSTPAPTTETPEPAEVVETPPPIPEPPEPPPVGEAEPAVVRMLGGPRVVEHRYYQLAGEATSFTLPALQERLRAHPPTAGPDGRRRLHILIDEESVAFNHPAVRGLEEWARFAGYDVVVRRSSGSAASSRTP